MRRRTTLAFVAGGALAVAAVAAVASGILMIPSRSSPVGSEGVRPRHARRPAQTRSSPCTHRAGAGASCLRRLT